MELVIGNKNYSSWSLRGWLMLKGFDIPFTEIKLPLRTDIFTQQIGQYTAARKVPALIDGDIQVWDSLSICEYINETYLDGKGWPLSTSDRALARSISCEMHSGFFNLRAEMPMNCRAKRSMQPSDLALEEIKRIDNIWATCREKSSTQGEWLFGDFSIADIMYAPVALRFATYQTKLSDLSSDYVTSVLNHPAVIEWTDEAMGEEEIIQAEEVGTPV